jgi:hypothetical protein
MLSPLLGTTIYNASQNVAMRFVNLSDLPSQTLGDILFPKSASKENFNNPARLKYYYEKTVAASLCFVIPLVLVVLLLPKLIIFILAGPQYYDAVPYLQLISFTCIFLAFLKQYCDCPASCRIVIFIYQAFWFYWCRLRATMFTYHRICNNSTFIKQAV